MWIETESIPPQCDPYEKQVEKLHSSDKFWIFYKILPNCETLFNTNKATELIKVQQFEM